jgi:hypothetical protein
MKRVLPGGWDAKGCYPAAGVSFFIAEKKKMLNIQHYLKLREWMKHEKGAAREDKFLAVWLKKPCQNSIPIELNGAKPTTHRAIYGYVFLGKWLCAQLPGWLSVHINALPM